MGYDMTATCSRRNFLAGCAGTSLVAAGCGGDVATGGSPVREVMPTDGAMPGSTGSESSTGPETSMGSDGGGGGTAGYGGGSGPRGSTGTSGRRGVPPNIVLVTLDDVGWTTLPQYGNPFFDAPALEALAQEGILFRNAFLPTSSCSPSRGVLLTGQYPHTNGLIGLAHRYPEFALEPGIPTLPDLLRSFGYATCMQGKWHVSEEHPSLFGFDEFLNDITGTKKIHSADVAIEFIQDHARQPFYLELNFVEPHLRWKEIDRFPFGGDDVGVLPHWLMPNWPEIRELAVKYYGEIWYVDGILGDLFAALKKLGLEENTLVALVSDNGAPFPGNKQTLYDRGIGTPLIMRWPAVIEPYVSGELVSIVDVPQTLVLAATQQTAPFMQGERALFDHLLDHSVGVRDATYSEMTYHSKYIPTRAVRTDRWKYIRNLSDDPWGLGEMEGRSWAEALLELPYHDWDQPRPPAELYDVLLDPHEVVNLVDDPKYADVLDDMHARMLEFAETTDDDAEI
jgi:arylsulfatase A-like enzyme